jgi:broad specificity phosphatase PhoE
MARLSLIRHGRAAAGWDTAIDPPLDEHGRRQAATTAENLAADIGDSASEYDVVTSPLLRCRETADAFASIVGRTARVETRIAEIPSPPGIAVADRVTWLRRVMRGTWSELIAGEGAIYGEFRSQLIAWARTVHVDTFAFSHFVAINAIIGAALGDDRLVIRSLDNASVTTLNVDAAGSLTLVEGGSEADTLIR